eukprot:10049634-Alexandrium_andersonii.AAC.1
MPRPRMALPALPLMLTQTRARRLRPRTAPPAVPLVLKSLRARRLRPRAAPPAIQIRQRARCPQPRAAP